jgi:murein DD-endopeptidase MepM/ murein hydrolase activator NlpD
MFVAMLVVSCCLLAPTRASAGTVWIRPVDGPVVRGFEPPRTRYGRGHLGVDFAAAPGTPVRAAGPGIVVFAGRIGSTLHVVVLHVGDLRTSYDFLASIRVHRGTRVVGGDVLGTTGGRGEEHDGRVLHLGLRHGDEYLNPMTLFGAVDLSATVHLAPLRGRRNPSSEPPLGAPVVLHIASAATAGARFTHRGLRAA